MTLKEKVKNWLFPVLTDEQKEAKKRLRTVINILPIAMFIIPFIVLYGAIKDMIEG